MSASAWSKMVLKVVPTATIGGKKRAMLGREVTKLRFAGSCAGIFSGRRYHDFFQFFDERAGLRMSNM